ncbi:MAG: glycosyltransferase, partial [Chitinophagaceae bacterium]
MKTLAPIVLFCYNRPDTLKHTVESLRENYWADESDLFIFSDGAKKPADEPLVAEVRAYLKTITGFKTVIIKEAPANKGLANSIIGGVNEVINRYDKVIVLEDDLVSSSNFLVYMNNGLDYYRENAKVFSITGFSIPIRGVSENTVYYTQRANSCGWGTWKDRWNEIDWEVKDYAMLMSNRATRRAFNKMGSDMTGLLVKQKTGKINSWAIRWCYHQFKHDLFSVHPVVSKIKNIGYAKGATHTKEKPIFYGADNIAIKPEGKVMLTIAGMEFMGAFTPNLEAVATVNPAIAKYKLSSNDFISSEEQPFNIKLRDWELKVETWKYGAKGLF